MNGKAAGRTLGPEIITPFIDLPIVDAIAQVATLAADQIAASLGSKPPKPPRKKRDTQRRRSSIH